MRNASGVDSGVHLTRVAVLAVTAAVADSAAQTRTGGGIEVVGDAKAQSQSRSDLIQSAQTERKRS
jgi:hypothetical protein